MNTTVNKAEQHSHKQYMCGRLIWVIYKQQTKHQQQYPSPVLPCDWNSLPPEEPYDETQAYK